MAIKDCSDADKFCRDHGISEEVWQGRPYVRWTPSDLTGLDREFGPDFSLRRKVAAVVTEQVVTDQGVETFGHNGSGWIMFRYAPDTADLPHVYAEIRPDNAVELRPARSHYHGPMSDFPYPILEVKESSMMGGPKWIRYQCPEGSDREFRWVPCYKPTGFAMAGNEAMPGGHINRAKDKGQDNHAGTNNPGIHAHVEEAKYLFNPSPKVEIEWEHTHDEDHYVTKPDMLVGHMDKRHRGEGLVVDGPHSHFERIKDPDRNYAARIDCHPMAAKRLVDAEVVFFALEGCIKADALLTAIQREGWDNASVLSVPSVSLWDCPELALVVSRFLKGKTVVIVVDADGVDNPRVTNQAAMCQTLLKQYGVDRVFVTAPALDADRHIIVDPKIGKLKGVDDFLAAGYSLGDLAVSTSIAPEEFIMDYSIKMRARSHHQGALYRTLVAFSTFAGETGQLHAPQSTVGKVLGVSHQAVSQLISKYVDDGTVTVYADPARLKAGKIASKQDWRKKWDWEERPFIILAEEFRATSITCPLKDVL